jgi:excisionase family DNA binding protein
MMDDETHKAYLKIPEAAARLDVAGNTIRNAIRAGKLTAYKILGTYRIKPEDLDAFIRSCRVEVRVREAATPAPKAAARARTFKHLDGQ